jgi:hypothetical protein
MKTERPPDLAIWLLDRCMGERNDSLIGDLIEEYGHGRGRTWFWTQTCRALVTSVVSELRGHPLLILRAMVSGWVALYVGRFVIDGLALRRTWPDIILPVAFDPLGHSGFHWLVLWIPVTAASGWIVSRLDRQHRNLVLLFALSVLLWDMHELPWICSLVVDSLGNSRFVPYLLSDLASLVIPPAGILLGGLRSTAQVNRASTETMLRPSE